LFLRPKTVVSSLSAIVGLNINTTDQITSPVAEIIRHPLFDAEKSLNDVAILKLQRPIPKVSYDGRLIGPNSMQLPGPQDKDPEEGEKCMVLGWGSTLQMGTKLVYCQYANLGAF